MDYKQDGNGEGLYGARNENSVLFSLDSLTSLDKDSGANSAGSHGSSGDASGLIDLNTLQKMNSPSESGNENEMATAPIPMESVVFNRIVDKKSKRNRYIIAGVIATLVIGFIIAVYVITSNYNEKVAAAKAEQALLEKAAAEEAAAKEAQIKKLQDEMRQLEADAKERQVDQEKVKEELERRQAQLNELTNQGTADPKAPTGSNAKKTTTKPDSGAAEPAPAPAKPKAPSKDALIAALKEANTKAAKCGKNGTLGVSFGISGGSAKNVQATGGTFKGSATERCVLTVFSKHNWPEGTASGIKYTVKL